MADETKDQKGSVLLQNTDIKMTSRLQEDMESVKHENCHRWHLKGGLLGNKSEDKQTTS